MNENDFITSDETETGTEVTNFFAQNIPGTVPSFDTMENDTPSQKPHEVFKKKSSSEEHYKATSINNPHLDEKNVDL